MIDVEVFDRLLLAILPPEHIYAVGGRVRDEIRAQHGQVKLALKDADYVVTGLPLADLVAALTPHGRVDQVGANFSVIKFTREGDTVDIALPRREYSTGSGHRDFHIESGPEVPLVADLARRDFRMNMLARSLATGEVVDPYGGVADILARRIDILSAQTFLEDPLRMLRACQFAARFEYTLTSATQAAMHDAHAWIRSVSAQRVGDEFSKLLQLATRPSIGFEYMRSTRLLSCIWPELEEGVGMEQNEWHAYDVYRHNLETLDAMPRRDVITRLAALLHDVGKPRVKDGPHFYRHEIVGAEIADDMLRRLALSNETISSTVHLIRQHMYSVDSSQSDAAIRRFIKRIGPEHIDRLFALRVADICGSGLPKRSGENEAFEARVAAELRREPAVSVADLAVNGQDVLAAFIQAGEPPSFRGDRRVGVVLHDLLEIILENPSENTREVLSQYLHTLVRRPRSKQRSVAR